jgi:membrane-associated protein
MRTTVAWIAGLSGMNWWRFLFWNAAGGIVWATTVALAAYYLGQASAAAIQQYGLYAGVAIAGVVAVAVLVSVKRRA